MTHASLAFGRNEWCAKVATLCAPGLAEKGGAALAAMLPDLDYFPDTLFTADTARAVARWPRKLAIPAYDEVVAALNAYRREFVYEPRPALPAPRVPDRQSPAAAEIAAVAEAVRLFKARGVEAAIERDRLFPDRSPVTRPIRDVTLKGDALRAFRARCGNPVAVPGPTAAPEYPEPEPLSRAFPPGMREPAGDDGLDELLPEGAF